MKIKKLWLVTIAALWCSMTVSAYDFYVDGFYYNIISSTDLTVEVTRSNSYEYSVAITIPSEVTYNSKTYCVTSIGNSAFAYCSSLTSITIPEGVTSIGSFAFEYCSSLTSITIPEGVTSIGSYAFYNCISLKTVINYSKLNIQKGSTNYGDVAYYAEEVINNPVKVGDYLFATIDNVHYLVGYTGYETELILPQDFQGESYLIIKNAFRGCSSLTSITIPEGVTSISSSAFWNCSSLTYITIPEGVTSIGEEAFWGCYNLTSIILPKSVTSIGSNAFYNCSSLTTITIPEGVTSIGNGAFYNCSSLTTITIPEGVTSIGNGAFSGTPWYNNQPDGVVYIGKVLYKYKGTMPANTAIVVKEGTVNISPYAFYNCSSLTSITIPEGVTSIGAGAFEFCSSLTSITIPKNSQLTSIGDNAFYGCENLKTVINYSDLTFQKGDSGNGYVAFYADKVLNVDYIVDGYCFKTKDGVHYLTSYIGDATELTLPTDYQGKNYQIGERAFRGCSNLTSITIPEGVTSIGDYAFQYCTNLKTVINYSDLTLQKGSSGHGYVAYYAEEVINVVKVNGVTLNQATATLTEGESLTLTATIVPDNATDKTVAWSSSNMDIATVNEYGVVTAVAPGTATITAKAGGKEATCVVTVEPKVIAVGGLTLNQASATLTEGETLTLTATITPDNATDKTVTWSSSNTAIAIVDANGKVTAVAAGTTTITAKAGDKEATCVVTVKSKVIAVGGLTLNQASATLTEGETLTLTATVTPDNATDKTVTWSTSNAAVATVDANGKVTAVAAGTTTITATAGNMQATCVVTVKSKVVAVSGITLSQTAATLIEGESFTLTATVTPDNATDKTVTWSTSDATVATVDNTGKVTAVAEGAAAIIATVGDKTAVCVVTVTKKEDDNENEDEDKDGDEEDEDAGIDPSTLNPQHSTEVYDLSGRRVLNTENLKGGVYIVGGKKVVIK